MKKKVLLKFFFDHLPLPSYLGFVSWTTQEYYRWVIRMRAKFNDKELKNISSPAKSPIKKKEQELPLEYGWQFPVDH